MPINDSNETNLSISRVYIALFSRSILALVFQILFFGIFVLLGNGNNSWRLSADLWLLSITLVNIVCIYILSRFLRKEGKKYRDLWRYNRSEWKTDLKWLLVSLIVSGPLVLLPNLLVGFMLWGSSQVGADLSFRALPISLAIVILITFPITQAMAELATYFGYVMPRLEVLFQSKSKAWVVSSIVLALQHVFLPLLFDWRFFLWRALMFIPFALWTGFILQKRPNILPFMMVIHGILDLSLPLMVLSNSL